MNLTFKDNRDKIHAVVIPRKEIFFFRPELPNFSQEKRAALLFTIHGKSVALIEGAAATTPLKGQRHQRIGGKDTWFSGPDWGPGVLWRQNGVDFLLMNNHGAVNQQEAIRIVGST